MLVKLDKKEWKKGHEQFLDSNKIEEKEFLNVLRSINRLEDTVFKTIKLHSLIYEKEKRKTHKKKKESKISINHEISVLCNFLEYTDWIRKYFA